MNWSTRDSFAGRRCLIFRSAPDVGLSAASVEFHQFPEAFGDGLCQHLPLIAPAPVSAERSRLVHARVAPQAENVLQWNQHGVGN